MLENLVIVGFGLMVVSTIFSIGYFLGMSEALDIMENYSVTEVCPHWIAETRTLSVQCGCETTAEFCVVCGEILTEPKTDC